MKHNLLKILYALGTFVGFACLFAAVLMLCRLLNTMSVI